MVYTPGSTLVRAMCFRGLLATFSHHGDLAVCFGIIDLQLAGSSRHGENEVLGLLVEDQSCAGNTRERNGGLDSAQTEAGDGGTHSLLRDLDEADGVGIATDHQFHAIARDSHVGDGGANARDEGGLVVVEIPDGDHAFFSSAEDDVAGTRTENCAKRVGMPVESGSHGLDVSERMDD